MSTKIPTINGTYLRFYVHENRRHNGTLLYEWLLSEGNRMGFRGGSAFRAIAGFGRYGVIHEQHFFELAGDLTVEVEFILTLTEAERMLDHLQREQVRVVYARLPAEIGIIEGKD